MEKEFKTLSEKIGWVDSWQIVEKEYVHPSHQQGVCEIEDIKEFIKELKGILGDWLTTDYWNLVNEDIDKLAGKDLI